MDQYKALLRATIGSGFKSFRGSLAGKKGLSTAGFIALLALFAVIFGGMCIFLGFTAAQLAIFGNLRGQMVTVLLVVVSVILIIFSVIYLLSTMYFSRDNEFLLSLPIKNITIYLAKITAIYLYLFAISLFFALFGGVAYGVFTGMPWTYYIGLLVAAVFLPIMPLFVSTLFSFPLMYLVSLVKGNRIISTILVVLGIGLFVAFYIVLYAVVIPSIPSDEGAGSDIMVLPPEMIQSIKSIDAIFIFYSAISNLFVQYQNIPLSILYLIGCNVLFIGASAGLSMLLYRKGMAKQLEGSGEMIKATKGSEYSQKSITKALVIKELKNIVRTPILFFYALLEIAMPIIMIVVFNFSMTEVGSSAQNPLATELMYMMSLGIITFCTLLFSCSMNFLALSTISREGKSFFIMKTIPVSVYKQLEVKGQISCVCPMMAVLIAVLVSVIMGIITWYTGIFLFIFCSIVAFGFTYIQISYDVKKPRIDSEDMAHVLQNNFNSAKAMGVSALFSLGTIVIMVGIFIAVYFKLINLFVGELLIWSILIVLSALFTYLVRRQYVKNVVVDFEKIES